MKNLNKNTYMRLWNSFMKYICFINLYFVLNLYFFCIYGITYEW